MPESRKQEEHLRYKVSHLQWFNKDCKALYQPLGVSVRGQGLGVSVSVSVSVRVSVRVRVRG